MNKKICVIGLGYIGLPTASLLATKGYKVLGVDVSEHVVNKINQGEVHIVEPDLDILVKSAVNSGNLKASLSPEKADIFVLAVPTPFHEDKTPDLSYVEVATKNISSSVKEGDLVILESTSPVGTTDKVARWLSEFRPELKNVHVAHCPERVIPGKVLQELVENDRVVGGVTPEATEVTVEFYKSFVSGEVLATDAKTAEMCKLTENASRDVNIAFANELSLVCQKQGINVWELIQLANRHPRVNILQPGPGVGGHCIAVDPWFIIAADKDHTPLMQAARHVNDYKPEWVIERVKQKAKRFNNPTIACFGLAFKADIDDLRESPALDITKRLMKESIGEIIACEPNVHDIEGINLVSTEQALERADIVVILVDHKPFKEIPMSAWSEKCVVDTRGILSVQ